MQLDCERTFRVRIKPGRSEMGKTNPQSTAMTLEGCKSARTRGFIPTQVHSAATPKGPRFLEYLRFQTVFLQSFTGGESETPRRQEKPGNKGKLPTPTPPGSYDAGEFITPRLEALRSLGYMLPTSELPYRATSGAETIPTRGLAIPTISCATNTRRRIEEERLGHNPSFLGGYLANLVILESENVSRKILKSYLLG